MDIVQLITDNMTLVIIGVAFCTVGFGVVIGIISFLFRLTRIGRAAENISDMASGFPGMGGSMPGIGSVLSASDGIPAGAIGDLSQGIDGFGMGTPGMSIGGQGINLSGMRRARSGGCLGNLIGGGITGLVGLIFLGIGGFQGYTAISAESWPTVPGEIEYSSVNSYIDSEGTRMFEPAITYSYTVDGVTYSSERIKVGGDVSTNIRSIPEGMVSRYPVGTQVTVHYDPANPSSAVIETGVASLGLMTWVFGGIGALTGFIALLVMGGGVFALLRGRGF